MTKSLFRNIAQLLMGDTDNPPASDLTRAVKKAVIDIKEALICTFVHTHYNYIFKLNQYINVYPFGVL